MSSQGQEKGYSRTRDLESEELLEQLPALQQLLYRLIGCKVLKESFKTYCAVNDGIINLVDKVLTEYVLVSVTSAVTVTIAGVVKEAVTILVAVLYIHDQFTWLKGLGLFTIIVGVSLFNWYKYWKLQKGEAGEEDVSGTCKTDSDTKYDILDEMDEQEEST